MPKIKRRYCALEVRRKLIHLLCLRLKSFLKDCCDSENFINVSLTFQNLTFKKKMRLEKFNYEIATKV